MENGELMKFVKINQQNGRDFFLINLANVNYIATNQKSSTCKIFFANNQSVTLFPPESVKVLKTISEMREQNQAELSVESKKVEF